MLLLLLLLLRLRVEVEDDETVLRWCKQGCGSVKELVMLMPTVDIKLDRMMCLQIVMLAILW